MVANHRCLRPKDSGPALAAEEKINGQLAINTAVVCTTFFRVMIFSRWLPQRLHKLDFSHPTFNQPPGAIAPPFHPCRRTRRRPASTRSSPATGRSSPCGQATRKSASTEEENRRRPTFLHAASKAVTGNALPCLNVEIHCRVSLLSTPMDPNKPPAQETALADV